MYTFGHLVSSVFFTLSSCDVEDTAHLDCICVPALTKQTAATVVLNDTVSSVLADCATWLRWHLRPILWTFYAGTRASISKLGQDYVELCASILLWAYFDRYIWDKRTALFVGMYPVRVYTADRAVKFRMKKRQADRSIRRTIVFGATFMTRPGVLVPSFSRNICRRCSVYPYTYVISASEVAVFVVVIF